MPSPPSTSLADRAQAAFLAAGGAARTSLADLAYNGGGGGGTGAQRWNPRTITAAAVTAVANDFLILDATANDQIATMPAAPTAGDQVAAIRIDVSGHTSTIVATPKTIQGDVNATLAAGTGATFVYDGANWVIGSTMILTTAAIPAFAAPTIALGTAAAAGAAATIIRSDATIAAFDATVPVTQAFADAASAGSVAFAARRNHVHGMPAAPTPPNILRVNAIAFSATITPNANTTDVVNIGQLTGAMTVLTPSGSPVDGQILRLRVIIDASTRVLTLDTGGAGKFAFGTDITAAMIPSAGTSKFEIVTMWNTADSRWRVTGIVRGF